MGCSLVVIGEINTDIIVGGLPHFPDIGGLVNGDSFTVGPGGKSRNIAVMAQVLSDTPGAVAMVAKTTTGSHDLWKVPIEALKQAEVNIDHVTIDKNSEQNPGMALILVDTEGSNQVIGAPGIMQEFGASDIDKAESIFEEVGKNNGYMVFIGNCPIDAARRGIELARKYDVKILFDPGGASDISALKSLLSEDIYLCKPNEHETFDLTGVKVADFNSAAQAAKIMQASGVQNVLITAGASGAYLFTPDVQKHIKVSTTIHEGNERDETGCGDQTLATMCWALQQGKSLEEASVLAVHAGTLQFYRSGIAPVTKQELTSQF